MYGGHGARGKRGLGRVAHTFRMDIGAYNIIYSPYIHKPPSNLPLQKMVTGAPDMTLLVIDDVQNKIDEFFHVDIIFYLFIYLFILCLKVG